MLTQEKSPPWSKTYYQRFFITKNIFDVESKHLTKTDDDVHKQRILVQPDINNNNKICRNVTYVRAGHRHAFTI